MAKINISDELFEKIKSNLEEYGFKTIDEYVEFVLNEVLNSDEEDKEKETFSKEEEEIIKKRLQDLGYLD